MAVLSRERSRAGKLKKIRIGVNEKALDRSCATAMGCTQQGGEIMADFKKINGSCFCGQNQFELSEPAVETHHCHCSICRRLQGAAFVTLSIFLAPVFVGPR